MRYVLRTAEIPGVTTHCDRRLSAGPPAGPTEGTLLKCLATGWQGPSCGSLPLVSSHLLLGRAAQVMLKTFLCLSTHSVLKRESQVGSCWSKVGGEGPKYGHQVGKKFSSAGNRQITE